MLNIAVKARVQGALKHGPLIPANRWSHSNSWPVQLRVVTPGLYILHKFKLATSCIHIKWNLFTLDTSTACSASQKLLRF